jgi:hypothetical protein
MTITLDGYTAIDMHRTFGFLLNNDGTLEVPTEDPSGGGVRTLYEGIEFLAPTGLEVNLGAPRQIPVVAQGTVQTTFLLPSIDAKTATLRAAYEKLSVDAALTGTKIDTIGEAKAMAIDSDKVGQERLLALITSQLQAHSEEENNVWANVMFNRVRIKPNRPNIGAEPMAKEYAMSVSRSTKRPWGETYTEATHGKLKDVGDVILSEYKFNVGFWVGNGAYTTFFLPTNRPALTSAKAKVWDFETGAARAGAWNAAENADTFTPSVLVPDGRVLMVSYEYE